MKFFKHFTDAHRGKSLRQIRRKLGMEGIGRYWTLVALCAEKMEKEPEEEFTERHCFFEFDSSYIKDELGFYQLRLVPIYLRSLVDLSLILFEWSPDVVSIYMPKLLECLDRDIARARKPRAKMRQEEERERDREKEVERREFLLSPEQFVKDLPIITLDMWRHRYGENLLPWLEDALGYFATIPAARNWNTTMWVSKVGNALSRKKMFDEQDKKRMHVVSEASTFCGIAED